MSSSAHAPAYPWGEHGTSLGGLTKRELFAAMAMQGLIATEAYYAEEIKCASDACKFADALLAALDAEAAQ